MSFRVIRPLDSESRKGQKRDDAGALDRYRQLPLMLRTVSRSPARHNFAAFGNKALERAYVLIIDCERLIRAEAADLAASTSAPASSAAFASTAFAATTFALAIAVRAAPRRAIISVFVSISVSHCYLILLKYALKSMSSGL
jgi:hypothetical protein